LWKANTCTDSYVVLELREGSLYWTSLYDVITYSWVCKTIHNTI